MRKNRRCAAPHQDAAARLRSDEAFRRLSLTEKNRQSALDLAARLICEEGRPWSQAAAEAQETFNVRFKPEDLGPAVRRRRQLFEPDRHARTLALKRLAALRLMEALPALRLQLIGHVLEGSATDDSAIELVHVSEARGAVTEEKEAVMLLLDAGLEPDVLEADYPTAFGRRLRGRLLSLAVDLTRLIPSSARGLVHPGEDVPGLTALIRLAPADAPLPAPRQPDPDEDPLEARGALGADALAELLARTAPQIH